MKSKKRKRSPVAAWKSGPEDVWINLSGELCEYVCLEPRKPEKKTLTVEEARCLLMRDVLKNHYYPRLPYIPPRLPDNHWLAEGQQGLRLSKEGIR